MQRCKGDMFGNEFLEEIHKLLKMLHKGTSNSTDEVHAYSECMKYNGERGMKYE